MTIDDDFLRNYIISAVKEWSFTSPATMCAKTVRFRFTLR